MMNCNRMHGSLAMVWVGLFGCVAALDGCAVPTEEESDPSSEKTGMAVGAVGTPTWPISGVSASLCYHVPGSAYHAPSGGISNADETYALDLNCKDNGESGKSVVPVRSGTVRQVNSGSGWVLVEHSESISTDGVNYPSFFTGYMHMRNIPTTITAGASVTTSSKLGEVWNTACVGCGVHLHFVVYVGSQSSGNNGKLIGVDPSALGGDFATFGYGSYVWRRWVDDASSSGSYIFVSNGTVADVFSTTSYGIRGSMKYTTTKTGSDDNSFEYKFNVTIPTDGQYYAWPFIPSNNATTNKATYRLLSGTSTSTATQTAVTTGWPVVDQYSVSDDYFKLAKVSLASGRYTTIKVGDGTGESNKKLGADQVVLWRKTDHCLGACSYAATSEKDYCLVSDYRAPTSGCTATTSVAATY